MTQAEIDEKLAEIAQLESLLTGGHIKTTQFDGTRTEFGDFDPQFIRRKLAQLKAELDPVQKRGAFGFRL